MKTRIATLVLINCLFCSSAFTDESAIKKSKDNAAPKVTSHVDSKSGKKALEVGNRFEKAIAAFEESDKASPPASGGILFTGASGIRLWKTLEQDFPGLPVLNRGFGGSQISDSIHFIDRVTLRYKPRTIVIQAGGNDLNAGKSPEQVFADFKTYVEKTRAVLPDVKIVYLNIGPSPKRWEQRDAQRKVNQLAREYIATQKNLVEADLWPGSIGSDGLPKPELYVEDQLHPSAAGYELRTSLLRPMLQ